MASRRVSGVKVVVFLVGTAQVCAGWVGRVSALVILFLVLGLSSASAGLFGPSVPGQSTMMIEIGHRAAPRAYYKMCKREPILCEMDQHSGEGRLEAMSDTSWQMVLDLNEEINARIRPRDDLSLFGVSDFWTRGLRYGDCEDYVIAKKEALIARGIAPENLLYGIIRDDWNGGYHATLILRTTDGDYVLDNLRDRILPWEETGYDFIMRQSGVEAEAWVAVEARGASPQVALSQLN